MVSARKHTHFPACTDPVTNVAILIISILISLSGKEF